MQIDVCLMSTIKYDLAIVYLMDVTEENSILDHYAYLVALTPVVMTIGYHSVLKKKKQKQKLG